MKAECEMSGAPANIEEDWWWCEEPACDEWVLLCEDCLDEHWEKIRCPKHQITKEPL